MICSLLSFRGNPSPFLATRDSAWLAHNQNNFVQVAILKLDLLKEALSTEPLLLAMLHDLERVLEDMALANRTTMDSFCASGTEEAYNPGELILHTVEQVRTLSRNTVAIEVISLPEDTRIPILRTHFQQVLLNVMKNASEAVPAVGGRIVVAARLQTRELMDPRHGSRTSLHITVEDNGPGIPLPLQRSLQQGPVTMKTNGHGLGLSHARNTLNIYGGSLRFDPKDGPGARAHIVWPL